LADGPAPSPQSGGPPPANRLLTLDALRGVAVMAILLANLPGFALPDPAYSNPLAWGGGRTGDLIAWALTEIFVNGRMRGLFSLLFGASMLLMLTRADEAGRNGASLHLRRMAVLFAFGMAHLTFIWTGDILAHYALVGVIALAFVGLGVRPLVWTAIATAGLSMAMGALECIGLFEAAARNTPQKLVLWSLYQDAFGTPGVARLMPEVQAMRGSWATSTAFRIANNGNPLFDVIQIGPDTLSAMLLGMAALKSGFLTGQWPRHIYRRWAVGGLAVSMLAYAAMAAASWASGFDVRMVALAELCLNVPFRLVGTIGYAALILLAIRPGTWWTERVAAAGRMAFTNYLGTSILMTLVFYGHGLGQFARWPRASLYLLVIPVWAWMLLWSKPWLDRFGQGPLERIWRLAATGIQR